MNILGTVVSTPQNALYSLSSRVLALGSKNGGSLKNARIAATEACSLQIVSLSDVIKYIFQDFTQTEMYLMTDFSPLSLTEFIRVASPLIFSIKTSRQCHCSLPEQ